MHLMLDIETLGTDSRAVVLSLGSTVIGPGYPSYYMTFANAHDMSVVDQQIEVYARTMTGSTIAWWINQTSKEAKDAVFHSAEVRHKPLYEGMLEWLEWVNNQLEARNETFNDLVIWGNSAAFDCSITKSLLEDIGIEAPWKFWNEKCYRTLKGFFSGIERPRPEVPHHAMHDALAQAKHLEAILNHMETSCPT